MSDPISVSASTIEAAAAALRSGRLVAFPTETVYGLGADATDDAALERLYAAKGRPRDHPVIVHLGAADTLGQWGIDTFGTARRLTEQWWPGPLTVVVQASPVVSRVATGGLETVALRVPAHPVALALLDAFDGGIAAPSANRFGRVSPTTASAVAEEFGAALELILDGGQCAVGVESTIVDCTSAVPRVLRLGAITTEMIADLLGEAPGVGGTTRAPGTLAAHYAPNARVEIVSAGEQSARLAALLEDGIRCGVIRPALGGSRDLPAGAVTLATIGSAQEYAYVLYSALRRADDLGMDVVLAVEPPGDGLGAAVGDRLRRAATGR